MNHKQHQERYIYPTEAERRQYFRIDDRVFLDFQRLSEGEFRLLMENPEQGGLDNRPGLAQLRSLTNQMGNVLTAIRKRDPEVAQYLAMLDKKIEMVARVSESAQRGQELQPNADVNISAGGIAFETKEDIPVGSKLELEIIFFPSYLSVRALGEVVSSTATEHESRKRLAIAFSVISEPDQEGLVRHVLEKQSAALRRARGLD